MFVVSIIMLVSGYNYIILLPNMLYYVFSGPLSLRAYVPEIKFNNNNKIIIITNKANSIIGLLRRNLRIPSQTIKTHAYQSLVRPHLEYASTVWDPHTQKNIHNLT